MTNYGTVAGGAVTTSGTSGNGVTLSAGGALVNYGTIGSGSAGSATAGVGVLATGSAATLQNGGADGNGTITGGVTLGDYANQVTLHAGSAISGSLNIGTSTSATLALAASGSGSQLYSNAVTGTTTFSGALAKEGTGTWTLDTALAPASVALNAGTLVLDHADSIGSAGTISFGGGTLRATASNTTDYSSRFSSAASQQYAIDSNSQNLTLASALTSSGGSFTKSGSGSVTLTGTNTYSGGTWISGGTLTAGHVNAFGTGALTIGADTVLDLANYSIANTVTNNGGTILNAGTISGGDFSGGTTDLSGSNSTVAAVTGTATVTVSGTDTTITTISGGTLNVNAAGTTIQSYNGGNVAVGAARTVTIHEGTSSGILSGAGGLAKAGSGNLTLTGANTYTGSTTVTAGLLTVNGDISSSALTTVGDGATLGGSGAVGALIVQNGATLAPGNSPGTLTAEGTTTFASGSIFAWELDTSTSGRGVAYDAVNTAAVTGSGAIFKIMLTGTQDFSDSFWLVDRSWTDIFKSADGSTNLTDWASVFGGGFQYSYNNGITTPPPAPGAFTLSGNSLSWSPIPEPTNALAGLLAASALLRRRRQVRA